MGLCQGQNRKTSTSHNAAAKDLVKVKEEMKEEQILVEAGRMSDIIAQTISVSSFLVKVSDVTSKVE